MAVTILFFDVSVERLSLSTEADGGGVCIVFDATLTYPEGLVNQHGLVLNAAKWRLAVEDQASGSGQRFNESVGSVRYRPPSGSDTRGTVLVQLACRPTHFSRILSSLQAGLRVCSLEVVVVDGIDATGDGGVWDMRLYAELAVESFSIDVSFRSAPSEAP